MLPVPGWCTTSDVIGFSEIVLFLFFRFLVGSPSAHAFDFFSSSESLGSLIFSYTFWWIVSVLSSPTFPFPLGPFQGRKLLLFFKLRTGILIGATSPLLFLRTRNILEL